MSGLYLTKYISRTSDGSSGLNFVVCGAAVLASERHDYDFPEVWNRGEKKPSHPLLVLVFRIP